ncbi:ABC transporter permease [Micromonospora sp. NBC_01796]|uniref:ABC transporter permease n=1 Tax=Micromonospora sp. NBC_01796 TaxID=2975987 RepID=UPI002DDC6B49|nr:ABC transporter permease [Micromonospora sp. NBC_01796]WSA82721.1 ABC transporter permease [Micromonospora sp. NBC_01796]
MIKLLTVAEMALREMVRRRSVLVILLVLPLLFYLSRRGDHLGQSIRFVCLGLGWALSTAALFAGSAAREIEPRLRLSGYRAYHLHLGRLLALWVVGLLLSVPYFLLIRFDQHDVRYGAIALIMLLTVATAAPFGLVLSAVLPRELEGTLVLLIVFGLQMMLDPAGTAARFLPFWASREIGTYAVDHTDTGYLTRGLVHGVVFAVALTALVALASGIRLRQRSHLRLRPIR